MQEKTGREGQEFFLIVTLSPSGSILGMFSSSPPPVMCAMPFTGTLEFKSSKTCLV